MNRALVALLLLMAAPMAYANDVGQLLVNAVQVVATVYSGGAYAWVAVAVGVANAAVQQHEAKRRARNSYNDSLKDRTVCCW